MEHFIEEPTPVHSQPTRAVFAGLAFVVVGLALYGAYAIIAGLI